MSPQSSPWKLLAMDWDGPCVTSARVYYRSVCEAFRHAGMSVPSFAFFRDTVSMSVDGFYERTGLTARLTREEIARIRDTHLKRYWHEIRPTPGLVELMRACARREVPFFIVSSNERALIERKLRERRLRRFVGEIISTPNKKEHLEAIAKRRRIRPRDILFVEDSSEPIVAANELGVTTMAFLAGFNSRRKLLDANPTFIAEHLRDVTGLIAP